MPFTYILLEWWHWIADTGINLALLFVLALLVPRAGRFINRYFERQVTRMTDVDEGKSRLALVGVAVYIGEIVAYFLLLIFALQQIGFSLAGAAIPATVVSAAVGFGAQSIIADFLAGFFVLTEKQYGVGDYVSFQGSGVDIEGEVIQITMRATQIRTIEQATVSIPNSTARVCINQSNYWSNAMVVIPVPLLGSRSADEAIARSERAARRALAQPEIAGTVRDELQVHPAVGITPPATVGSPWTVDMRFLVRVDPLAQWMVERAIRVAILDEFWNEYGSATTLDGTLVDAPVTPPTTHHSGVNPPEAPSPVRPPDALDATDTTETPAPSPSAEATNSPTPPHPVDDPAAAPTRSDPASFAAHGNNARTDDSPSTDTGSDHRTWFFSSPQQVLNGIMRMSTLVLLAIFGVLLLIRGFMVQPGEESEADSGFLAPPARTTAQTTETVPDAEDVAPTYEQTEPEFTAPAQPTTGAQQSTEHTPLETSSSDETVRSSDALQSPSASESALPQVTESATLSTEP